MSFLFWKSIFLNNVKKFILINGKFINIFYHNIFRNWTIKKRKKIFISNDFFKFANDILLAVFKKRTSYINMWYDWGGNAKYTWWIHSNLSQSTLTVSISVALNRMLFTMMKHSCIAVQTFKNVYIKNKHIC